jgi:hypothetical protein
MADCNDLFMDYLGIIRVGSANRKSLRNSRNANRERIKEYFTKELDREAPLFYSQGSYPMHTIITPEGGDYDLDDGIYLQGLGTDLDKWPVATTVHKWIVNATEGYTTDPPQDKNRCVRVRYAANYHIDLPIYAMDASGKPLIFDKSAEKPYESDSRAYTVWFQNHIKRRGAQLRNVVRYLKAWREHHRTGGAAAASGLGYTILAVNNYVPNKRDDLAFAETAKAIYLHMRYKGSIRRPVFPHQDLTSGWDQTKRENFLSKLESLSDRSIEAIEEADKSVAAKIWERRVFGYRFPDYNEPANSDNSKNVSAVHVTSRPAMHGLLKGDVNIDCHPQDFP